MDPTLNLNLLRVLRVLLREQNLTKTAELIGQTQPAVSAALSKLRLAFDDQLLVRAGGKMELTAKARTLIEPLEDICGSIDTLLRENDEDISESSRNVVIATTDYGTLVAISELLPALKQLAPRSTIQFIDTYRSLSSVQDNLAIDFHLLPEILLKDSSYHKLQYMSLFEEEFVTIVASARNADTATDTTLEYAIYHLGLESFETDIGQLLGQLNADRKVALRTQQFSLLPFVALQSGMAASVPRRLAEAFQKQMPLDILETDESPVSFKFCLAWHPAHNSDRTHAKFRQLIEQKLSAS